MASALLAIVLGIPELVHRFSEVVQKCWLMLAALGFLLAIVYYEWLFVFIQSFPSPGTAVVWLTLSAGVMSLQPDMNWKYKVVWVFILGYFGFMELKSIDLDRQERVAEVSRTLGRIEQISRATSHIEHILAGQLPVPAIQITSRPPTSPPSSALMQFDHTAMIAAINPATGMLSPFLPEQPLIDPSTQRFPKHRIYFSLRLVSWPEPRLLRLQT
jgi:hypothetical protein